MKHSGKAQVKWLQMAAPNGEVFSGFWVVLDGVKEPLAEPLTERPLMTRKAADAVATLENVAEYINENSAEIFADAQALDNAFDLINGAYRQVIDWKGFGK